MEVVHLNQKQLATRWSVSEARLPRWRSAGIGPKFLKLCGRVLYRQVDIEAYEASCLATSTKSRGAQSEVLRFVGNKQQIPTFQNRRPA
ncbi:helix-turn-helix transcriptional regulator [Sulfurivermis fontis]|uniref:helix-turn-helix transcriptional regulator n=1 Tax=Sulfurivermis fontis TaxID=1972068 RepID=UPI001E3AF057|nr:DNA-binding protein [Sulfurivermis fontis]